MSDLVAASYPKLWKLMAAVCVSRINPIQAAIPKQANFLCRLCGPWATYLPQHIVITLKRVVDQWLCGINHSPH